MKRAVIIPLSLLLASCQTWGPTWSEVTGERYTRAATNRRPAIIERVDDATAFPGMPTRIAPGRHAVLLQGFDPHWRSGGTLQTFELDARPCQRYYINAQFDSHVSGQWQPVIDHVELIPGCRAPDAK
jgi:hypothetical protein